MNLPKLEELGADSSDFIKLEDGAHVTGVLYGDPVFFRQVWNEGEEKQIYPVKSGAGTWRFRMNFLQYVDGAWKASILENGTRLYAQIQEENEIRPIENSLVRLSRTGSGKKTTYQLRFIKEVPEDGRVDLAKVELQDLDPMPKGDDAHVSRPNASQEFANQDIPF